MTMAAAIEVDGERAVVVKRASGGHVERLRREGERLRRASHPGVVEVLRSGPAAGGWELRTAHAGRPLSTVGPLTATRAAAVAAAVASTLADLHQLGIVHGRIDATHVLLGEHGRPVLCGFGDGSEAPRAEDDVAALGALLVDLLGPEAEGEPIPERRWRPRRAWSGWDRRALLTLADQACADHATRRPTARRFAAALTEAVPGATQLHESPIDPEVGDDDPIERLRPPDVAEERGPSRAVALLGAATGAVVLVAVALWLGSGEPDDAAAPLAAVEPIAPAPSATTPVTTGTAVAGSVLTADERRYRVGQEGDLVLVDDWGCHGTETPALLRPSTSEVFVFPRWIEQGTMAVEPVGVVPGAETLVSQTMPDGCTILAARTADGTLVPVTGTTQP